jgi:hypothetical protein
MNIEFEAVFLLVFAGLFAMLAIALIKKDKNEH